ncbi:MAG: PTS glucose transporter subunit IIA [Eisenbergiella sp.]
MAAPAGGRAASLSEVNDDVFSQEVLGKGAAIFPAEGKVYAPADGTLTVFFDTGHAVGMQTAGGAEILIHVGIDTVNLQGKYFTPKAKVGDQVKAGQFLLEFALEAIQKEGYDTVIPVIVTVSGLQLCTSRSRDSETRRSVLETGTPRRL